MLSRAFTLCTSVVLLTLFSLAAASTRKQLKPGMLSMAAAESTMHEQLQKQPNLNAKNKNQDSSPPSSAGSAQGWLSAFKGIDKIVSGLKRLQITREFHKLDLRIQSNAPNMSQKLLEILKLMANKILPNGLNVFHSYVISATRDGMKSGKKKAGNVEVAGRRLLARRLESMDGSTHIPATSTYDGVKTGDTFDMQFAPGRIEGDVASAAAQWMKSQVTTVYIRNNNNGMDTNDDDDDNSDAAGVTTAARLGYNNDHAGAENDEDNNNNDNNNKGKHSSDNNAARTGTARDDFTASFHVDYHNPRTHPPKNN